MDAEYLNSPLRRVEVPSIAAALRPSVTKTTPDFANRIGLDTTTQVDLVVATNKKKKKKKKSPSPPTLDATNIDDIVATPINCMTLSPNITSEYEDDLKVSQELSRGPSPVSFDGVHPSDPTLFLRISPQPGEGGNGSLNSSASCSVHSLNSASDEPTPLFVPPSDPLSAIEATNNVLLAVKEIPDPSVSGCIIKYLYLLSL